MADGLRRIPDVEIFATGNYRGRDWTLADLQTIHRNWLKFGVPVKPAAEPYMRNPVVLGHEEDQDALKRTDLPGLGWVDNVRLKPIGQNDAKLVADFEDVDPELAKWIDEGKIRETSAEFFDDFADDQGNHHGLALRRVAVLGGELPQVKRLNSLPKSVAKFSDRNQRTVRVRRVFKFSEGTGMNRDQMMELVKGSGLPFTPEFLDSLSDEQLAGLIQCLAPKTPDSSDPAAAPAPDANKMADGTPATAPAAPAAPAGSVPASQPSQIVLKYSDAQLATIVSREVAKALAPVQGKLKAIDQQTSKRLNDEKSGRIKTVCDKAVKEGRMLPANRPVIEARLMRADAVNCVHKFADGKEAVTEFDAQLAEIEAAPVIHKFGEKMPEDGNAGSVVMTAEQRDKLLAASPFGRSILRQRQKSAA